jgi:hypothetical protein
MEFFTVLAFAMVGLSSLVSLYVIGMAFVDTWWKGVLCLFCQIYFIWYSVMEFQHSYKLLLLVIVYLAGGLGYVILADAGYVEITPIIDVGNAQAAESVSP